MEATGELDQYTGPLLDAAVTDALDAAAAAGELVLDVSGVHFCDSGGLNTLIRTHLRARDAGAVLRLVSPTAQVAGLFRRTGGDRLLLR
ncbi:STAS domain-containing protein [Kitasatospora paranensis]|uniref:STAS domain-containing protein n=1 Tax=Kitasatospora paranensis TaxID=258053 RepID=UPI0031EC94DB